MSTKVLERNFEDGSDFQKRIVSKDLSLYYLESIVKVDEIEQFMIQPILNLLKHNPKVDINVALLTSTISSLSFKTVNSYSDILKGIVEGNTFIYINQNLGGYLCPHQIG
jgi:Bacillus/Clostridium GerA spore germination protein